MGELRDVRAAEAIRGARVTEMTDFVVIIHTADEGGYWAEVPALEGCFAQGETVEDALVDARGAIASHLQALRDDGQPVPAPHSVIIGTVTVVAA